MKSTVTTPASYFCIKIQSAPKTSLHATGSISYAVLRDADRKDVYFCLLGNEGGGYFSQEAIPFSGIKQCLQGVNMDRPIPAKAFRAAFRGQSANNPGFLVAALRHEGLLHPAPDSSHQHILGGNWDDWRQAMLAVTGESFELPEVSKAKATQASTISNQDEAKDHKKDQKTRKSAGSKREMQTVTTEGGLHASPA